MFSESMSQYFKLSSEQLLRRHARQVFFSILPSVAWRMWFETNGFLRTSDHSKTVSVTLTDCIKTWSGTRFCGKEKLKEMEE